MTDIGATDFPVDDPGGWAEAHFRIEGDGRDRTLVCVGPWRVSALEAVDQGLRALLADGTQISRIDVTRLDSLDTVGAWLLHRVRRKMSVGRPLLRLKGPNPNSMRSWKRWRGPTANRRAHAVPRPF